VESNESVQTRHEGLEVERKMQDKSRQVEAKDAKERFKKNNGWFWL
jgi:hypothetical protein